jgi:hypothetical protein
MSKEALEHMGKVALRLKRRLEKVIILAQNVNESEGLKGWNKHGEIPGRGNSIEMCEG